MTNRRKIIIEKTIEAKPGSSFVLGSGFSILPPTREDGVPLIVCYKQEEIKKRGRKPIDKNAGIELSEEEKIIQEWAEKEKNERREWLFKWQIRPGSFTLSKDYGWVETNHPEEIYFETETSLSLQKMFSAFLAKKDIIAKYKKNKRSYLLYSDPGMGKSALIRRFCKKAMESQGTAILQTTGDTDFSFLMHVFSQEYAPEVERIVLVIEDFGKKDNYSSGNVYNPACLNFLDGNQALFRVPTLILTTTNFLKELGPQLTGRPGRFNKIIKVDPPSDQEVFALVEYVSGIALSDEQKTAFAGKGFTPDYCVEAILRSEFEDVSLIEAVKQIRREQGLAQHG